jgi:regulator of sirC expression with transglutaminase-like and TPR domain
MITAGLSGWVERCAPGNMRADGTSHPGAVPNPARRTAGTVRANTISTVHVESEFASLLARSRNAFPLDRAAMLIAREMRPGLDVDAELEMLDRIAGTVPERSFPALLDHLCNRWGLTGNTDDYYDPRNSLLDEVLHRRLGIPILLAVVAIEVGRRIDVPVDGIALPGHFIIRGWSSGPCYADPFRGPQVFDEATWNSSLRETYALTRCSLDDAPPATNRQIVTRMLANLKSVYQARHDHRRLAKVMVLRSKIPGIGDAERDELLRLMAPMN